MTTERKDEGGEAVAWLCVSPDGAHVDATASENTRKDYERFGRTITPLYTHPSPSAVEALARAADGVPESEWRWHGLAAHYICAADCLFHMATEVGGYMISTVGDLRLREKDGSRGERQEIGCGRTYETFVFTTKGTRCDCGCGMPEINLSEIDSEGANDPADARTNHMAMCAMCAKYAAAPQAQGEGNG